MLFACVEDPGLKSEEAEGPLSSDCEPPWYRRPLPPCIPAWLVLSVVVAIAGSFFATWAREYTVLTVISGGVIGFFAGLLFSMAMESRLGRGESPTASHLHPPPWLSLPASVALLLLIGFTLLDETSRQGYYDGYGGRHLRYFRIPGPLAACLGGCCLIGAEVISIGNVRRGE